MAQAWNDIGLDRLVHRVDSVAVSEDASALVVQTRVAGAGSSRGLRVVHRWSQDVAGVGVRAEIDITVEGRWDCSVPRLGYSFALPSVSPLSGEVSWFGTGPGESYADSRMAARVGSWSLSVGEFQTPYVVPQENGCRRATRRARVRVDDGVLEVLGHPTVDLSIRPWSNAELALARHAFELPDPDRLWFHLDAGQEGLGSATCGPGVRTEDSYHPESARLEFTVVVPGPTGR